VTEQMTEQLLRDGLREAIMGEPTMGIDAEEVTTHGRRGQARRRALLGTVVATVLIAVAGSAFAAQLGTEESRPGAGPDTSVGLESPTPEPLWPFAPEDGTYTGRQYGDASDSGGQRMPPALDRLPGVSVDSVVVPNLESHRPGEETQYWLYRIGFTTDTGTYEAEINAYVDAAGQDDASTCENTDFEDCDTFPVLGGRGQGLYGFEPGDPESSVEISLGDGQLVWLIVDGSQEDPKPLSQEEMTDVLVDFLK
jgi:hypothetical protein